MVEQHANVFLNGSSCSLPSTGKTSQQAIWFRDESLKSQQQFYYRNCLGTIPVPHFATYVAKFPDTRLTTTAVKCAAEYGVEVFFQLAKHFHQTFASFAFTANCPVQLLHFGHGSLLLHCRWYVHILCSLRQRVFCLLWVCDICLSIYIYVCNIVLLLKRAWWQALKNAGSTMVKR